MSLQSSATALPSRRLTIPVRPPLPLRHDTSLFTLLELILKRPERIETLIRDAACKRELLPRFLMIALGGFVLFGLAMTLVLRAANLWPQLAPLSAIWDGTVQTPLRFVSQTGASQFGAGAALVVAYSIGLIAASGICLPSLYFYCLLAGVRMSALDVVMHTLKSKATAAVALVGILPIYAALALGIVIFPVTPTVRGAVVCLGLALPFVAGLWGTWSLYRGFMGLTETLPAGCRGRRACFLRRLVLAWSACYTAVTPVLVHTLWQRLG